MVDFGEWIAIGLGVLAVGIAAWDNLRDRFYSWRGPVSAELLKFDMPQSEVLVDGVKIRMSWTCQNRLSWPVLATFNFTYSIENGGSLVKVTLQDELFRDIESNQVYLPPRQPVDRTLWVTWPRNKVGKITPSFFVFSRSQQRHKGPTREVAWSDAGCPFLQEVEYSNQSKTHTV